MYEARLRIQTYTEAFVTIRFHVLKLYSGMPSLIGYEIIYLHYFMCGRPSISMIGGTYDRPSISMIEGTYDRPSINMIEGIYDRPSISMIEGYI